MAENAAEPAAPTPEPAPPVDRSAMSIEDRIAAIRKREDAPEPPPEPERAAAEPQDEPADEPAEPERAESEAPDGDAQPSDEEVIEASSLDDLAEHLGVEIADLYNLKVRYTKAGERTPSEISLSELKDSFQALDKLKTEQSALAKQREQWESERQTRLAALDTRLTEAAALAEYAERAYMQDAQGINWEDLRQNAPEEWAAKRYEFNERKQQLEAYRQQVTQRLNAFRAEQAQQAQQSLQTKIADEASKLLEAVPEWRDESRRTAERGKLVGYLRALDFSDHDIANAADHRLIVMARKAMLYDEQAKQVNAAKKKVIKIGKSPALKPGARQSRAEQQQDALKGLRSNLRKSGRVEDAAALIAARRRGR